MVVSIVLERTPELEFSEKVDLDNLVKEAFRDFQRDRSRFEGMEKQVMCLNLRVTCNILSFSSLNVTLVSTTKL